MKYILNDSIMLHELPKGSIILSVTGKNPMVIDEKIDETISILNAFLSPSSYEEAYMKVCSTNYILEDDFQECFEFMRINNILKEYDESINFCELTSYHIEKYKRQISSLSSLPGIELEKAYSMQSAIRQSTICIIGVGGTGSHLALALASIGVESLILVDYDDVELSNTARQILYDETDIGKRKIDVAKEKLLKYNSRLHIDTYSVHIERVEDLDFIHDLGIDLLVLCADTPRGEIQYIIDSIATKYKIAWFGYAPYNHSQISVGPLFVPGKSKTYSELFPHMLSSVSKIVSEINDHFVGSICDPYNGFASQFAAIEVFKYISGYHPSSIINRRYYIDTDTWKLEYTDYD